MGRKFQSLERMLSVLALGASMYSGCKLETTSTTQVVKEQTEETRESAEVSADKKKPLKMKPFDIFLLSPAPDFDYWSNLFLPPSEHSSSEEEKSYFPLAEGNNWTYIRTVNNYVISQGVLRYEVLGFETLVRGTLPREVSRRGAQFLIMPSAYQNLHNTPKTSEERYIITKKVDGFWKVKVDGNDPSSRDGRYEGSKNWEDCSARWSYLGLNVLEIRDSRMRFGNVPTSEEKAWLYTLRARTITSDGPFQMGAILHKEDITVPAGTFTDCLKSVVMIYGKNLEAVLYQNAVPEYENFRGFITESYLAKDVGLVKEVQYNEKGEETYRLELKSYQVKQ